MGSVCFFPNEAWVGGLLIKMFGRPVADAVLFTK